MKTLFTALSPNTQPQDIHATLQLLRTPFTWQQGPYITKLTAAIQTWLGREHVFLFESGRSCLYAILKSLELTAQDEVLLQAYTCVAVPDPILWVKAKPVYVDIDASTYNMSPQDLEKKITKQSKVLIIQHTFGTPADMDALLAIAKKHQLFVIEDCAHAMGAEYKGKPVGTFGNAAFFSTGRDKVISSVFGGIATTSDTKIAAKLTRIHDNARYPSWWWIRQQLNHPLTTTLAKSLYNVASLGKILIQLSLKTNMISYAVYPEEKTGRKPDFVYHKMPNALAYLAYLQFQKLETYNTHRKQIAAQYAEMLDTHKYLLPKAPKDSKAIYLRYTIQTDKADELRAAANKSGIVLGDWYTHAIAPAGVDYKAIGYDPTTCPQAEAVSRRSLNLPTHIGISKADAKRIVEFLNTYD